MHTPIAATDEPLWTDTDHRESIECDAGIRYSPHKPCPVCDAGPDDRCNGGQVPAHVSTLNCLADRYTNAAASFAQQDDPYVAAQLQERAEACAYAAAKLQRDSSYRQRERAVINAARRLVQVSRVNGHVSPAIKEWHERCLANAVDDLHWEGG